MLLLAELPEPLLPLLPLVELEPLELLPEPGLVPLLSLLDPAPLLVPEPVVPVPVVPVPVVPVVPVPEPMSELVVSDPLTFESVEPVLLALLGSFAGLSEPQPIAAKPRVANTVTVFNEIIASSPFERVPVVSRA